MHDISASWNMYPNLLRLASKCSGTYANYSQIRMFLLLRLIFRAETQVFQEAFERIGGNWFRYNRSEPS